MKQTMEADRLSQSYFQYNENITFTADLQERDTVKKNVDLEFENDFQVSPSKFFN